MCITKNFTKCCIAFSWLALIHTICSRAVVHKCVDKLGVVIHISTINGVLPYF